MSLAQREAAQPGAAAQPRPAGRGWAPWLIMGCYLLGSLALTWRLWARPAVLVQVGTMSDLDLFAWFIRYDAAAVAHGSLPDLVTTALNAPHGVNLMWNTSLLLPGVLLAPVTLLAGPQVTLTVMLTAGFAGSAASCWWVLRRWGASQGAAALGGAVYGFSPALLTAGESHYQLQFAVLPPLIIDAVLRIVTGRGRAWKNGVWLGLLTSAQVFIGEELLVITAVAAGVLVILLALCRPRAVPAQVRGGLAGFGTTVAVTLLTSGYALYVQFLGPLAQHGSAWPAEHFRAYLPAFVTPSGHMLFHTPQSAAYAHAYPPGHAEYLPYLGWPLLAVVIAATIGYWRDLKARLAGLTFALLAVFSIGGETIHLHGLSYPGAGLPWHWLARFPVLSDVLPDRFALLAAGSAAAVLAFALSAARPAAADAAWWRRAVPAAVAVLAVLPLIPRPYQVRAPAPVPAGWQAAFARLHLPASAPVLVVPIPYAAQPSAMRWQAITGRPETMNAGYFIGPDSHGRASPYGNSGLKPVAKLADELWAGSHAAPAAVTARKLRSDLAYWHPAAVVAVARPTSRVGRLLTGLLGPPAFRSGQLLVWRR